MATIDILTVFNGNNFPDNNNGYSNPDGQNSYKYAKNEYVRMVSDSPQATNNGQWDLEVQVKPGDVIRWLDTPITQGESQTDMLVYNFHTNQTEWDKYLEPLEASNFHTTRFYIDTGFQTNDPKFQYVAGPNNFLTATLKAGVSIPAGGVTLTYFLQVVKLTLVNGVITRKGTYGIDPKITIKP